jgi:hypothetical protein
MTSTHIPLVLQKCVEEYKSTHEEVLKSELKFVEKCAELCWTMRISGPTKYYILEIPLYFVGPWWTDRIVVEFTMTLYLCNQCLQFSKN